MKNILYILIIFFKINPIYALVVNEEVPVYYFVNQEKVINNLKEKLDKTNIVAVTGVTGVGKSELVRMFVKKYYKDYEIICFIDTNTNFIPQFIDVAREINSKLCQEKSCISENPAHVKNSLMHYLKSRKNWLIIFDGLKINENSKVQEFIDWKHNGHIIICSQDIENMTHRISTPNIYGKSIKLVIDEIMEGSDEKFKNKLASLLQGYPTYLVARSAIFLHNNNHMTIDEYMKHISKNDNKIGAHLEMILRHIPKNQQDILFKLSLINNQKIPKQLIHLLVSSQEEYIEFIHNTVRFGVLEQVNEDRENQIFRMHDSLKDELVRIRGRDKIRNDLNSTLDVIDKLMPASVTDRLAVLKNNSLLEGNIEVLLKNGRIYNASHEKMIQVGEKLLWYYLLGSRQVSNAKNLVEWFKTHDKDKLSLNSDKEKIAYANFLVYVAGFEYSIANVAPEIAMNYLDRAEDLLKNISNEEELVAYIYATKAHIQIATGEFDKAANNVEKAEQVKPKVLRTFLGANVTKHLKSQIYLSQGRDEEALDLVSKTIDAPDAVNTKHHNIKNIEDRSILLAPEYITKAKILNNLKRYDEAFKVLSDNVYKYIKDGKSENFHILLARTLVEIARAENGLKRYDSALSYIQDSIAILTRDNDNLASSKNIHLANALFIRGEILFNKNYCNEAIKDYKTSKDIYINIYGNNAKNINTLADLLSQGAIASLGLEDKEKSQIWANYFYKLLINIFGLEHPKSQSIAKVYYP